MGKETSRNLRGPCECTEVGRPRSSEEGSNDPGAKGVCCKRVTMKEDETD